MAVLSACSIYYFSHAFTTYHSGGRLTYVNPHSLLVNGELPGTQSTSLYAHRDSSRNNAQQVTKGLSAILFSVGLVSQIATAEQIQTLDFSMVSKMEYCLGQRIVFEYSAFTLRGDAYTYLLQFYANLTIKLAQLQRIYSL
jgi:hypothetical protein